MIESSQFVGVTRAQKELVSYWQAKRAGQSLPARADIDPGDLKSHLSAISMVEALGSGSFKFRLVGSDLRRILGQDVCGQFLEDVQGAATDMLSLGLESVLDREAPTGGIIDRVRDRHAWLRLPFRDSNGRLQVLCHDALISSVKNADRTAGNIAALSNRPSWLAA